MPSSSPMPYSASPGSTTAASPSATPIGAAVSRARSSGLVYSAPGAGARSRKCSAVRSASLRPRSVRALSVEPCQIRSALAAIWPWRTRSSVAARSVTPDHHRELARVREQDPPARPDLAVLLGEARAERLRTEHGQVEVLR